MNVVQRFNIRTRLTLLLATSGLTFLVLFSFVVYSLVQKKSYAFAKTSLVNLLEHEWEHIDLPKDHLAETVGTPHFKDIYLRVLKEGVLVYDSFPKGFPDEYSNLGELGKNKLFHSFTKVHNGHEYELQAFFDLTSTNAYLSFLRNMLGIGCLLAAIASIPMCLLATKLLLTPFRDLAASTSQLTAEHLTFRFQEPVVEDEYAILVRNFNDLLNRLERSFSQIKRFALSASHELRTPLAVIISQGELALRKERTLEEYRTALEKIVNPAKRLREIVNRLLFLAELERIGQEKKFVSIDVAATINELVSTIRDAHGENHKKVSFMNVHEPIHFVGNQEIFDVVIANLIENSYKFSRECILISYQKTWEGLEVRVEDDGPGIANDRLGFVFDPLSSPQNSETRTEKKQGSGLGLSIVKACIDSVRGAIRLSKSKLGGLSVTVVFPQDPNNVR